MPQQKKPTTEQVAWLRGHVTKIQRDIVKLSQDDKEYLAQNGFGNTSLTSLQVRLKEMFRGLNAILGNAV